VSEAPIAGTPPNHRNSIRRILATSLDGMLVCSLFALLELAGIQESSAGRWSYLIILSLAGPAYNVVLHAGWGQTVGKVYFGVAVVDRDLRRIRLRRAVMRELPRISWTSLCFPLSLDALTDLDTLDSAGIAALGAAVLCWWLADGLAMVTDPRRRSLHDRIAGTLVVRVRAEASLWPIARAARTSPPALER
jgi:uncharacterized RDD family membrane protein YckC